MLSTQSSSSDDSDTQTRKVAGSSKHYSKSKDYTELKNLQTLKTRRSIAKDFSQIFGRKISLLSTERISFRFLRDLRDERTKFNKLTKEQVGRLIKERQQGRSFRRIVRDPGKTFGNKIGVGIARKFWRINVTGEKTTGENNDNEDVKMNEDEDDESKEDGDEGDESEDDDDEWR